MPYIAIPLKTPFSIQCKCVCVCMCVWKTQIEQPIKSFSQIDIEYYRNEKIYTTAVYSRIHSLSLNFMPSLLVYAQNWFPCILFRCHGNLSLVQPLSTWLGYSFAVSKSVFITHHIFNKLIDEKEGIEILHNLIVCCERFAIDFRFPGLLVCNDFVAALIMVWE